MKRVLVVFVAMVMALSGWMVWAQQAAKDGFTDVPAGDKYEQYIYRLRDLNIIDSKSSGSFGYNKKITRAEFLDLLVKTMKLSINVQSKTGIFKDIKVTDLYYPAIYSGIQNGIIVQTEYTDAKFEPNKPITREEAAVMIVRALKYDKLAASIESKPSRFTDVQKNKGSIEIVKSMGIMNGGSETLFQPSANVLKQESAAILIRLYDAVNNKVDTLNGFYAIKSNAQLGDIKFFDSIAYGWSRLDYNKETGGIELADQVVSGGQPFYIPENYQAATAEADNNNVKKYFMIFGTNEDKIDINGQKTGIVSCLLSDDAAVQGLIQELLDKSNGLEGGGTGAVFDGVVIDFEALRNNGNDSANLVKFLKQLKEQLDINQKQLLVCVNPKREEGQLYYDGYDYKEIGQIADYVILMAHDYDPKSLSPQEAVSFKGETPLAPIKDIYYALRYATDPQNGVPREKLLLQINFGAAQWQFKDGKLLNSRPYVPDYSKIVTRMQDTSTQNMKIAYSDTYQAPYITYESEGIKNIIWYEDARSIDAKARLAKMFGINGISVWRLGQVPDFDVAQYKVDYMNLLPVFENMQK